MTDGSAHGASLAAASRRREVELGVYLIDVERVGDQDRYTIWDIIREHGYPGFHLSKMDAIAAIRESYAPSRLNHAAAAEPPCAAAVSSNQSAAPPVQMESGWHRIHIDDLTHLQMVLSSHADEYSTAVDIVESALRSQMEPAADPEFKACAIRNEGEGFTEFVLEDTTIIWSSHIGKDVDIGRDFDHKLVAIRVWDKAASPVPSSERDDIIEMCAKAAEALRNSEPYDGSRAIDATAFAIASSIRSLKSQPAQESWEVSR